MSATTAPKRQSKDTTNAPANVRSFSWLLIGGLVFVAAWIVWNFWLAAV